MSDYKEKDSTNQKREDHRERDADTQTALGIFIIFISIPVIIGTYWAEYFHARIVNIIAGVVLMGIGIGMVVLGRRTSGKT